MRMRRYRLSNPLHLGVSFGAASLVAVSLQLLQGAAELEGQQLGDACDLQSARVLSSQEDLLGQRITWIGLPDVRCADGVRIRADSAVHWESMSNYEFIGRFRYEDTERDLSSELANYFEVQGRLFARDQVQVLSRDGTTSVRGDTLNLLSTGGTAASDQMTVTGRPAYALIQPSDSARAGTGGEPEESEPYEVTALVLRFEGERFLRADGEVEVNRDSLHATSQSLTFDRTQGNLILAGEARMTSRGTDFEGRTITLMLPDDELRSMTLLEAARLIGEDLEVSGDEIRIDFEAEQMQHLVAVLREDAQAAAPGAGQPQTPEAPAGGPTGAGTNEADPEAAPDRPQAWAEDFFLVADSLDVRAPGGALQTVYAVGSARGESREVAVGDGDEVEASGEVDADDVESGFGTDADDVESGRGADPDDEPSVQADSLGMDPAFLEYDWIEGDTIVATFSPAEPGGTDEEATPAADEGGERAFVLERLVAMGNARTLYRSPPEGDPNSPEAAPVPDRDLWSISYLLADQITLNLVNGQVDQVEAVGNVVGYQAEPEQPEPEEGVEPSPEDTGTPGGVQPADVAGTEQGGDPDRGSLGR